MTPRSSSVARPFLLITGLFLTAACYVVDGREEARPCAGATSSAAAAVTPSPAPGAVPMPSPAAPSPAPAATSCGEAGR
jgi:hypothetical protein